MNHIRTDFPGAIHHVFIRGNNKQAIFLDDDDRHFFLGRLKQVRIETSTSLYAAGLMTNHFHLLPETGPIPLKTVMSRILTPYAMRFNKKHGRVGHLFYDRYKARICSRDGYFLRLLRYIHRNPVQAGIAKVPGDWPWSGHHDLVNGTNEIIDCQFPLSFFGSNLADARKEYARYVNDFADDGWEPETDDEGIAESRSTPISEVLGAIAAEFGILVSALISGKRGAQYTQAKRQFVLRGFESNYSQAEIARALNCTEAAVAYLRKT